MRVPAQLRKRRQFTREGTAVAIVLAGVAMALAGRQTESQDFTPTSGFAATELAPGRWMPHDHRPIVGFAPNSKETR